MSQNEHVKMAPGWYLPFWLDSESPCSFDPGFLKECNLEKVTPILGVFEKRTDWNNGLVFHSMNTHDYFKDQWNWLEKYE